MKIIVLLTTLFLSSLAFATEEIIEYNYGNQITGSSLKIFKDGTIEHAERKCCPPRTEHISTEKLSQPILDNLLQLIEAISGSPQAEFKAGQSGLGSSTGNLYAFNSNGQKFNIRTIGFGDGVPGPFLIQFNTAAESRQIEKFVSVMVLRKMDY